MLMKTAILLLLTTCLVSLARPTAAADETLVPADERLTLSALRDATDEPTLLNRRISPGDTILIEVFGEKDLKVERRVEGNGTITYPLLKLVHVAGKTPGSVAADLAARLDADYLVDPQVTVMVKEYRLNTVSVLGAVRTPGAVELPPEQKIDILEAIARAGDFREDAKKSKIELIRDGKSTHHSYEDLKRITDPAKRVWVQPGDVIDVKKSFF